MRYCWTCGSLMSGGYCPGCGRRIHRTRAEWSAPTGGINWYVVLGRIIAVLGVAYVLLTTYHH